MVFIVKGNVDRFERISLLVSKHTFPKFLAYTLLVVFQFLSVLGTTALAPMPAFFFATRAGAKIFDMLASSASCYIRAAPITAYVTRVSSFPVAVILLLSAVIFLKWGKKSDAQVAF
jgi:ABC-type amino acid transport system permease subunit